MPAGADGRQQNKCSLLSALGQAKHVLTTVSVRTPELASTAAIIRLKVP